MRSLLDLSPTLPAHNLTKQQPDTFFYLATSCTEQQATFHDEIHQPYYLKLFGQEILRQRSRNLILHDWNRVRSGLACRHHRSPRVTGSWNRHPHTVEATGV